MLFVLLVALGCTPSSTPLQAQAPVAASAITNQVEEQEEVNWRPSTNRSLLEAQLSRKPVVMYMYLDGCPYCAWVNGHVFHDPEVVELLNEYFVPIRMNAEDNLANMEALGTNTVPSLALLTPDGMHIVTIEGMIPPWKLVMILRLVRDHSKELDNQVFGERESAGVEYDEGREEYQL